MKTAPIETLRNPDAPKPGDFVLFRPWDKSLEDVSYWRRYATQPSRSDWRPETKRFVLRTHRGRGPPHRIPVQLLKACKGGTGMV